MGRTNTPTDSPTSAREDLATTVNRDSSVPISRNSGDSQMFIAIENIMLVDL